MQLKAFFSGFLVSNFLKMNYMKEKIVVLACIIFVFLGVLPSCEDDKKGKKSYIKDNAASSAIESGISPECDVAFTPLTEEKVRLGWTKLNSPDNGINGNGIRLNQLNVAAIDRLREQIGIPIQGISEEDSRLYLIAILGRDTMGICNYLLGLNMAFDGETKELFWCKAGADGILVDEVLLIGSYRLAECSFYFRTIAQAPSLQGVLTTECYDADTESTSKDSVSISMEL